jgi:hypothetical protein
MSISPPVEKKNRIALVLILILLNTYFFQHYDSIPNPNEQSRIYLITAIVDHISLSIDEEIKRFGDTIDISRYNGKAYCDKAPGLSFLGVPFYFLLKLASSIFGFKLTYPIILKFLRTVLLSIPSAFFSLIVLSVLKRFTRDFQLSLVMTIFYSLGTIAFTYSNLLFGHQLGAIAVFLLFYLIIENIQERKLIIFLSGFIAGYAVVIEYPLILIASVLSIYQLIVLKNRWRFFYFILGGLIPVIILLTYNYYAFGSILSTGYAHIANPAFAQYHKEGLMGVTTPRLSALVGSLFSSMRGVFYFMPLLIFSLYGLYIMWKDQKNRSYGIVIGVITLLMLYFISSFSYWQAGGTVSQRHLTGLIPFLIIPTSIALRSLIDMETHHLFVLASSLMQFSLLLIPYATIPFPFFSTVYPNPLFELPLNLWHWGAIPLNTGNIAGLEGIDSAIPFIILWITLVCYAVYLFLSLCRWRTSAFVVSIVSICITFLLITAASFVAKEKNYESKMRDVIGIVENFKPGRNSCEFVIEGRSRRFEVPTCYAFLRKGPEAIKFIREEMR